MEGWMVDATCCKEGGVASTMWGTCEPCWHCSKAVSNSRIFFCKANIWLSSSVASAYHWDNSMFSENKVRESVLTWDPDVFADRAKGVYKFLVNCNKWLKKAWFNASPSAVGSNAILVVWIWEAIGFDGSMGILAVLIRAILLCNLAWIFASRLSLTKISLNCYHITLCNLKNWVSYLHYQTAQPRVWNNRQWV